MSISKKRVRKIKRVFEMVERTGILKRMKMVRTGEIWGKYALNVKEEYKMLRRSGKLS